mmetsp:Transcript_34007/g.68494  ORF Transcript_34007/g.68494 Transcript_34007/m.68494 type:complete len:254 (+) Transcript_34007:122-883(+)
MDDRASPPPAAAGPGDNETNESLTNLKRDRDGYFARFSHKIFGDPMGFFGSFADDQRLERLEGCKALEGSLAECERIRDAIGRNVSAGGSGATREFEGSAKASSSTPQLKINRFYGWGVGGSGASDTEREEESRIIAMNDTRASSPAALAPDDMSANTTTPTSCSRETHSVWACRALALGCADHLVPLRKCLRATKSDGLHYNDGVSTTTVLVEDECALEQRALAKCVAANTAELEQRFKKREERAIAKKNLD